MIDQEELEQERALTVLPAQQPFTDRQLSLIKTTIAPGVDDDQLALFVEVAKRTGLDPFSRQIYAILRNTKEGERWVKKMTIQTGIDGYRAIAARSHMLAGIDDPVYDSEDGEHPNKATVTVWRFVHGQRCAFTASARWGEYKPEKSSMWDRMPYLMLGKCAEALALRKAFPVEISGVYTDNEMDQASNEPHHTVPAETDAEREHRRIDYGRQMAERIPLGKPTKAEAASTAEYNPLADVELRKELAALGYRTVAQVKEFVEWSCARNPVTRELCFEGVKRAHQQNAKLTDRAVREAALDAELQPDEPEPAEASA